MTTKPAKKRQKVGESQNNEDRQYKNAKSHETQQC